MGREERRAANEGKRTAQATGRIGRRHHPGNGGAGRSIEGRKRRRAPAPSRDFGATLRLSIQSAQRHLREGASFGEQKKRPMVPPRPGV